MGSKFPFLKVEVNDNFIVDNFLNFPRQKGILTLFVVTVAHYMAAAVDVIQYKAYDVL